MKLYLFILLLSHLSCNASELFFGVESPTLSPTRTISSDQLHSVSPIAAAPSVMREAPPVPAAPYVMREAPPTQAAPAHTLDPDPYEEDRFHREQMLTEVRSVAIEMRRLAAAMQQQRQQDREQTFMQVVTAINQKIDPVFAQVHHTFAGLGHATTQLSTVAVALQAQAAQLKKKIPTLHRHYRLMVVPVEESSSSSSSRSVADSSSFEHDEEEEDLSEEDTSYGSSSAALDDDDDDDDDDDYTTRKTARRRPTGQTKRASCDSASKDAQQDPPKRQRAGLTKKFLKGLKGLRWNQIHDKTRGKKNPEDSFIMLRAWFDQQETEDPTQFYWHHYHIYQTSYLLAMGNHKKACTYFNKVKRDRVHNRVIDKYEDLKKKIEALSIKAPAR